MESAKRPREANRIRYPPSSYFPMLGEVIHNVLPALNESRAAQLYLAMYHEARCSNSREFPAHLSDLNAWTRSDHRRVRRCIRELKRNNFVKLVDWGELRSRSHKPRWRVPLAEFDLSGGGWFPVPRFLITDYLAAFPGSLLLIIFLFYQHHGWRNHCWPGVRHLAKLTGWQTRTVYHAIHLMGHRRPWERLGTGLPRPLEITWWPSKQGGETRHFRVRAVHYSSIPGHELPVVNLTTEFAEHFGLVKNTGASDREVNDEVA